jgi:hypothetical protein
MKKYFILIPGKPIKAFCLAEIVIAVAVSTIFIAAIVSVLFYLYGFFNNLNEKSLILKKTSDLLRIVSNDVLNPDIYPRHLPDEYILKNDSITFFSGGSRVEYTIIDGCFYIKRPGDEKIFKTVKDFNIEYFDDAGLIITENEYPFYCELNFKISSNEKIRLKMRL